MPGACRANRLLLEADPADDPAPEYPDPPGDDFDAEQTPLADEDADAADADVINDAAATSSPSFSTYTLTEVVIDNSWSQKGKIYFGRTQRGTAWYYFRVFLKPGTDGFVVQGAGSDRYIVIEASFQSGRNVPFAKR